MPQIQGVKDEAVVVYCEPLITKETGYHRLPEGQTKWDCIKKFISHLFKRHEDTFISIMY